MAKIAVITNSAKRCGIHQYGATVHRVLAGSSQHQYEFVTTPLAWTPTNTMSTSEWIHWLLGIDCDAILYNHCPTTMGWLDDDVVAGITKPQFLITGHDEFKTMAGIKHHFVTNPMFENTNTHSAMLRPLVLDHALEYTPPGDTIKVGTFGLAYNSKNLPLLVKYVNDSFPSTQRVELNIHAIVGEYVQDSDRQLEHAVKTCRVWAGPNVDLVVTTDFIETLDGVIAYLNHNDINVFMYNDQPNRFAVSSALDLALSAQKPVAITRSSMFQHANHVEDIIVDKDEFQYSTGKRFNWLPDIMNLGMAPLEEFYVNWAPDKFRNVIEDKINEFC